MQQKMKNSIISCRNDIDCNNDFVIFCLCKHISMNAYAVLNMQFSGTFGL